MNNEKSNPCILFLILDFWMCTVNGSVPFHYVPSLNTGKQSTATLGVEKFIDNRPADDKDTTKSISDVDEKITSKTLEDFRSSQMFSAINFPASHEKDDLIIKGEIKRVCLA